jgi:hypothetical protein
MHRPIFSGFLLSISLSLVAECVTLAQASTAPVVASESGTAPQSASLLEALKRPQPWTDRTGRVFIGTPKGKNHFAAVFDQSRLEADWLSLSLKASETGLIAPEELADAKRQMTEEQYNKFVQIVGKDVKKRINDLFDPEGEITEQERERGKKQISKIFERARARAVREVSTY